MIKPTSSQDAVGCAAEAGLQDEQASFCAEWGYDCNVEITLTARNWRRIQSGKPLSIRGKGYWYEGTFFWDYWDFAGGLDGSLTVTYVSPKEGSIGEGWIGIAYEALNQCAR